MEKIELRATRLGAYDGRVLLVPNAEVFTSRIVTAFREANLGLPNPDLRLLAPTQAEQWTSLLKR